MNKVCLVTYTFATGSIIKLPVKVSTQGVVASATVIVGERILPSALTLKLITGDIPIVVHGRQSLETANVDVPATDTKVPGREVYSSLKRFVQPQPLAVP